jgi:osmotically-inducible protein OsmY
MRNLIIIFLLAFSLQGCIFVAGAAAGAAGIAVVYDHRKLEKILQDQKITNSIIDKIKKNPTSDDTHIDVTCFNQVVLLTGQTPTAALKQKIENLARSVPNINKLYNVISIKGPTSSLTRASDSWITTKIKTEMLATKDLQSGSIKVVTENGNVYLMGIVSEKQAIMTVDIARKVSGVQKVIKIFQLSRPKPTVR